MLSNDRHPEPGSDEGRAIGPVPLGTIVEVGVRVLRSRIAVLLALAFLIVGPGVLLTATVESRLTDVMADLLPVDAEGRPAEREVKTVHAHTGAAELGPYRHFMQKEIFEQPRAIGDTLEGVTGVMPELFGDGAYQVFKDIDRVLILACGTSYYAGLTADRIPRFVQEHLIEGKPIEEWIFARNPLPNRL